MVAISFHFSVWATCITCFLGDFHVIEKRGSGWIRIIRSPKSSVCCCFQMVFTDRYPQILRLAIFACWPNQINNKSDARTDMFQIAHLLLCFPSAGAYRLDHCLSACPATWRKALGGADLLGRLKSWFRKSLIFTLFECKIEDHYILSLYFKIGWFNQNLTLENYGDAAHLLLLFSALEVEAGADV